MNELPQGELQKLIEQMALPLKYEKGKLIDANGGYVASIYPENWYVELTLGNLIATAINNLQPKESGVSYEAVLKEIEDRMGCTCHIAYKSRGLASPDCAQCNYAEDIAEIIIEKFGNQLAVTSEPQPKRFTMQDFEKGLMLAGIIEPRNEQEAAEKKRLEDWEAGQNTAKEE